MELREIFIKQPEMKELLLRSAIGLEKENMRVWGDGHIALTPHPFGNKATHPFITTDFSESQVEIGTEVCANPHQVYDQLELAAGLSGFELIGLKDRRTGKEYCKTDNEVHEKT